MKRRACVVTEELKALYDFLPEVGTTGCVTPAKATGHFWAPKRSKFHENATLHNVVVSKKSSVLLSGVTLSNIDLDGHILIEDVHPDVAKALDPKVIIEDIVGSGSIHVVTDIDTEMGIPTVIRSLSLERSGLYINNGNIEACVLKEADVHLSALSHVKNAMLLGTVRILGSEVVKHPDVEGSLILRESKIRSCSIYGTTCISAGKVSCSVISDSTILCSVVQASTVDKSEAQYSFIGESRVLDNTKLVNVYVAMDSTLSECDIGVSKIEASKMRHTSAASCQYLLRIDTDNCHISHSRINGLKANTSDFINCYITRPVNNQQPVENSNFNSLRYDTPSNYKDEIAFAKSNDTSLVFIRYGANGHVGLTIGSSQFPVSLINPDRSFIRAQVIARVNDASDAESITDFIFNHPFLRGNRSDLNIQKPDAA